MAKPKIVYWKPGGVVRGAQVYLDANFLVGLAWAEHIWHSQATALRDSLVKHSTQMILSSLAFNEAIYQLLRLEEKKRDTAQDALSDTSAVIPSSWADLLDQSTFNIPNLAYFEPPDAAFHRQVIRAVRELNLDPTDAFHYAATRHLNCPIITNDAGFQKIPDQNLTIVTFF